MYEVANIFQIPDERDYAYFPTENCASMSDVRIFLEVVAELLEAEVLPA